MRDIQTIIRESVNKGEYPASPKVKDSGKINDPSSKNMKTQNAEYPEGRQDDPKDYDTHTQASKNGGSIFERLSPNQLNALLETLMRNKARFSEMYNVLAKDGFVPMNEGATYDVKRKMISEMVKDGQLAKQMLQTLVESKQIVIEAGLTPFPDYTDTITFDDLDQQNQDYAKYGRSEPPRSKAGGLNPGRLANKMNPQAPMAPTNAEAGDEGGDTIPDSLNNPEDQNAEVGDEMTPDVSGSTPDDEILNNIKGNDQKIGQAKAQQPNVQNQLKTNVGKLAEFAEMAGFVKPDGTGDFQSYGKYISDPSNYEQLPPQQREIADWYKEVISQQKQLTQNNRQIKRTLTPPIETPEYEPELAEAKNMQLQKGVGKSELQLRAGSKGKIFENRLRKLEPYKKVALLEFLENDPRMIDDQDYADMAVLTGICEGDLVAMRIEYEESTEDTINEVTYPVIGGQDVQGQNKKNEAKELNRDLKAASKSQETTEKKVHDFKVKKFEMEDIQKKEQAGAQDQNRGMHTQIDVLNAQDGNKNKSKYDDQANGVFGKRDPKEVKNDANVGDGKAGDGGVTKVGSDLLKKGEEQPDYYNSSENEGRENAPDTSAGKPQRHKEGKPVTLANTVNEDIDRMKGLFSYNTNTYANAKPSVNHNTIFEQQLNNFRVLTESVDFSARPSKEQLAEMAEVDFKGKKARTDGQSYFDNEGKKMEDVDEARNHQVEAGKAIKPNQLKAGTKGYDVKNLDEGKDTGNTCTECNHKVYETKDGKKCQCKGAPIEESSDPLVREMMRQKKLAGIDEAKRYQLRHAKGSQVRTGTPEVVEERDDSGESWVAKKARERKEAAEDGEATKSTDNDSDQSPVDAWMDKRKNDKEDAAAEKINQGKVVDEAKNLQLKHTKGLQLKTGTKVEDESK